MRVSGGIAAAMLNGVKRGLFSNEAGMGSAPNTAATATVAHPAIQGFIQALGVFIDTIIICSATAFIILVSGLYDPAQPTAIAGASLTQAAIAQSFGVAGQWFMTVVVFAFAFSSVLGNYAYADANLPGVRPCDIPGVPDSRVVCGADLLHYVPAHRLGFCRHLDGRYDVAQRDRHTAAITLGHRRAGRLREIPGRGSATGIRGQHYPWSARCVSGYRLVEVQSPMEPELN